MGQTWAYLVRVGETHRKGVAGMGGRFVLDYLGGFNVIEHLLGLINGIRHGDMIGHKITLPRLEFEDVRERYSYPENGRHWNMNDVREILHAYHIPTYALGFDESTTFCHVPKRQARWAEYLLARAGCPVAMATVDSRNQQWASNPKHGGQMPTRWEDRPDTGKRSAHRRSGRTRRNEWQMF